MTITHVDKEMLDPTLGNFSTQIEALAVNIEENLSSIATLQEALSEVINNPLHYLGEFRDFHSQQPPHGWAVRNGATLSNGRYTHPKLWAHLALLASAWKKKTAAQWNALNNAEPFGGIGGAPFFVVSGNNIKLPDTRDMYAKTSGRSGQLPGFVGRDEIRNITGDFYAKFSTGYEMGVLANGANYLGGAFIAGSHAIAYSSAPYAGWPGRSLGFSASESVPTGLRNQPAHFCLLGCVYVGGN